MIKARGQVERGGEMPGGEDPGGGGFIPAPRPRGFGRLKGQLPRSQREEAQGGREAGVEGMNGGEGRRVPRAEGGRKGGLPPYAK